MKSKIILAVLITLVIVFFGINNSGLKDAESSGSSSIGDFVQSIMGSLNQSPEPDNNFTITVKLNDSAEVPVESKKLEVEGLRKLNQIESNSDIGLKEFDGVIEINETDKISGTASGYYTDQLDTNLSQEIDIETDTELIKALSSSKKTYNLEIASGNIASEDENLSISDTDLKITSFKGDLIIRPQERKLIFEGMAASANSESISIGN